LRSDHALPRIIWPIAQKGRLIEVIYTGNTVRAAAEIPNSRGHLFGAHGADISRWPQGRATVRAKG
jgi:hypothetical protein